MNMNTAVSLLNIKEDLLDHEGMAFEINRKSEGVNPEAPNRMTKQARSTRLKTEPNTYDRLLASAIKKWATQQKS